jgi:hypothetical protein
VLFRVLEHQSAKLTEIALASEPVRHARLHQQWHDQGGQHQDDGDDDDHLQKREPLRLSAEHGLVVNGKWLRVDG